MTLVVDASVVAAALLNRDATGTWAESLLAAEPLCAPHLMPVEVVSILRRSAHAGDISRDVAALAHDDLLDLPVDLVPYGPFADRVWELRATVTPYDAWYVAVAEELGATLATLDARLHRAAGPRCAFAALP